MSFLPSIHPDRSNFRLERANLRTHRAYFRPEGAEYKLERVDLRPERAYIEPERSDFGLFLGL